MNDNRNRRGTVQNIRMQQEHIDKGKLQIQITSQVTAFPIQNAQVSISYTGVPENTLEKLQTDSSGLLFHHYSQFFCQCAYASVFKRNLKPHFF